MKRCLERLYNGLIKENPTFVLMLGMCPTLAVTTSAINGLGMGLSTMVVLALSNMIISALRKIIPDKVRIPAYIVIIATFVTIVELLMHAFVPGLYSALGIYISLIVVNCIILGRAESYASKNAVLPSLFDGIGMGLGFTMALTLIGLVREFLGAGTVFGFAIDDMFGNPVSVLLVSALAKVINPKAKGFAGIINNILTIEFSSISPIGILVMAPGAFFVLATLTMIQNVIKDKGAKAGKDTSKIGSGCSSDCMNCSDMGCARRMVDNTVKEEAPATEVKEEKKAEEKTENVEVTATEDTELNDILASDETDEDLKEESEKTEEKEGE
jgi:electron transport complex protein RnfE